MVSILVLLSLPFYPPPGVPAPAVVPVTELEEEGGRYVEREELTDEYYSSLAKGGKKDKKKEKEKVRSPSPNRPPPITASLFFIKILLSNPFLLLLSTLLPPSLPLCAHQFV